MRTLLIRAIDRATAWLDAQNDRVTARRAMRGGSASVPRKYEVAGVLHPTESLCPRCVFIRDDAGEITEVIDCQTLNHHHI